MAEPYFTSSPEWFEKPLDAAIIADTAAIETAAATWKNSETRTHVALNESDALDRFCVALGERLRAKTFHLLPGTKRDVSMPGIRVLEEPPWRGVFLLSADRTSVVGLLFSKEPHDVEARLDELIAAIRLNVPQSSEVNE